MEDPSTMAGEVYRSPKVWMKIDLPIDQISAQTPADSNIRIKHYIWNQLYRPVHLATVRSKNTFEKDPIVLFHAHRIPKHDYNASIALFLPLTPQWRAWWSENSRAFPMIGSATGKEQMLDHGQGWKWVFRRKAFCNWFQWARWWSFSSISAFRWKRNRLTFTTSNSSGNIRLVSTDVFSSTKKFLDLPKSLRLEPHLPSGKVSGWTQMEQHYLHRSLEKTRHPWPCFRCSLQRNPFAHCCSLKWRKERNWTYGQSAPRREED